MSRKSTNDARQEGGVKGNIDHATVFEVCVFVYVCVRARVCFCLCASSGSQTLLASSGSDGGGGGVGDVSGGMGWSLVSGRIQRWPR